MNGQLNKHPLVEVIRELYEKKLSGTLRVEHEHSKVVIYLEDGKVKYAASNVRSLRLSEYLKRRQSVSEEQLAKYAGRGSDLALASAISGAGLATGEEIDSLLRNLAADVLRLALLWKSGTWKFEAHARLDDEIRLDIDAAPLLLECARKTADLASSRFLNPEERISIGTRSSANSDLVPAEGFLITRVEDTVTISELVALSGLPEVDALRTIYGLTLAGFLKRENWDAVLRSAQRSPQPPPPAAPVRPAAPQRTEEDELTEFLARMDSAVSYYEVLEVNPDTAAGDIKQAYYGIARKYHPDRFRGKGENPLHARLESAFARITQAYETLMDASRRRAYDSKLAATRKAKDLAREAPKATRTTTQPASKQGSADSKEGDAKQTESIFQEGFAALQQGQIKIAIGLLAAAARAVPDESRYRAYYGRALAAHEKSRRSAESELQAAIRLDPNNAPYRVMLAELYQDLGFARRAISEAERALRIEPGNAGAREILKELK